MLTENTKSRKFLSTKNIAVIAVMAALASVFYMILEIPIIPFAPHLTVNFADVPALLAGMVVSPIAGVFVVVVRCLIHLFRTSSFGIGEAVDLIIGISMVISSVAVFNKLNKKLNIVKSYVITCVVCVAATIISGLIANLILYPVFMSLLGKAIESAEVFAVYLGGTVITNIVRSAATLTIVALFLPALKTFRKVIDSK